MARQIRRQVSGRVTGTEGRPPRYNCSIQGAHICFVLLRLSQRSDTRNAERKPELANLPFKSLLTTYKLSETASGHSLRRHLCEGRKTYKHTSMCLHRHTHRVQGATESRAVGVRLQERGHPKRRLLLSLFNRWLDRLFEGPFNCRGDGALKTRRLFSPLLLIFPLMTPIKTAALLFLPHSPYFPPSFRSFAPSAACFLDLPSLHISSLEVCDPGFPVGVELVSRAKKSNTQCVYMMV